MKTCKSCGEHKSLDAFSPSVTRQGNSTTHSHCKACRTEKGKRSRDAKLTTECSCCGETWRKTGGESRKNINVCPECYPVYRTAYQMVKLAEKRAKSRGLAFDLDIPWVYEQLKPMVCAKTGLALSNTYNGSNYRDRHPMTPSIDKIVPKDGYTKENVQFVCWWYNLSKSYYSDDEVLKLCEAVVNHNS